MAGTITATTIQNDTSSPPAFRNNSVEIGRLCRAWVNFNGTGTVAIRASFNVSSITDNGTGDYTVNFTTAMPDENYSFSLSGNQALGNRAQYFNGPVTSAPTTTTFRFETLNSAATKEDQTYCSASFFR
jgi:hypothetical protein